MIKITLIILISIFALTYQGFGQDKVRSSFKVINDKPSVYISYDHKGKQSPLSQGESENRIWLRLHNNTKLKIFFCEFWVDKEYGDTGVYFDVERFKKSKNESDISSLGNAQ